MMDLRGGAEDAPVSPKGLELIVVFFVHSFWKNLPKHRLAVPLSEKIPGSTTDDVWITSVFAQNVYTVNK